MIWISWPFVRRSWAILEGPLFYGGIPAVFLHGGPGAGSTPQHRRFFDPRAYRIVVYDQRGAGRSQPLGELRDNTTPCFPPVNCRLSTAISPFTSR